MEPRVGKKVINFESRKKRRFRLEPSVKQQQQKAEAEATNGYYIIHNHIQSEKRLHCAEESEIRKTHKENEMQWKTGTIAHNYQKSRMIRPRRRRHTELWALCVDVSWKTIFRIYCSRYTKQTIRQLHTKT